MVAVDASKLSAVILVEGDSDKAAVETLARRHGRSLESKAIAVVAMGGVTNIGHFLSEFGKKGQDLRIGGLCDEGEELIVARSLERHGYVTSLDRRSLASVGFHVCVQDLEDELIRALGVESVEEIVRAQGEWGTYQIFLSQPAQRGREPNARIRRFMGTRSGRKIRYGQALVEALDLDRVPPPLVGVLEYMSAN